MNRELLYGATTTTATSDNAGNVTCHNITLVVISVFMIKFYR
jgi:hypothetical protein